MPLDPYLEQGRRGLEDMLQASLAQINASRGMIDPQLQLQLARLRTNEGIDNRGLNEAMVGRGIYNSGVTTVNRNELTTQYDRQRQDMGAAAAAQYGQLSNAEAQARLQYQQGLQELLLQVAAMQAQNPSLGLPYGAGGTSAGIGFDYSKYFNPLI